MKHDQRTFGRRAADITPEQLEARKVAAWCTAAAIAFAALTTGAGLADKPGAVLIAYVAATLSLIVAIAASSEA